MDSPLEARIFSMAGGCLSANCDLENAAVSYGYAADFSKSPENMERAAIAYYRLSKRSEAASKKRDYMEKAEGLFRKAVYLDPGMVESHYYLGMIYSERGDVVNAVNEFTVLQEHPGDFSERVVSSIIESYILIKKARYEKESEAYGLLEDPFLVSFYEFVKPYVIETEMERELMERRGTDNAYSAIAMEIKELYDGYFMDGKIKKRIGNPVLRFGLMVGLLFSKKGREEELIDFFSKADFSDLRRLPLYTRGVVSDFLSKFGLTRQSFKMPYTIERNIAATEDIIRVMKALGKEKISKAQVQRRVRESYAYLSRESAGRYMNFFERIGDASYGEIYSKLEILKSEMIETIFRKLRAFYGKEETIRIFRLIVSSLELGEEDKVRILRKMEYRSEY